MDRVPTSHFLLNDPTNVHRQGVSDTINNTRDKAVKYSRIESSSSGMAYCIVEEMAAGEMGESSEAIHLYNPLLDIRRVLLFI